METLEMIITHKGKAFDTDKIERVKHIYGYGDRRSVRIYFRDCLVEHDDTDGSLYETFRNNGVYAS
jgi:hypothetical protein